MPQSLSSILIHLVFSTKHREPWLRDPIIGEMHAYLGGVLRELNCPSIIVGGTADHVHLLFRLARHDFDRQEEHHRGRSFQDEFRLMLTRYGIAFDEKYVWD